MGRSGTGKSVTLKLLMGLLKPDAGRIYVNDREVAELNSRELVEVRKTMGFLFQYSALFDSLSVAENVAFPLRRHTRMAEEEIQASVRERLAEVGLENELDKMPLDLSGGMRKRVGLARALALKPSILLVDEPSSGLDPITTREIDKLLMDLKAASQTTMVVVTHNVPSARRIGDKLVVLHEGHIVMQGTAEELDKSKHEVVQAVHENRGGRLTMASSEKSAMGAFVIGGFLLFAVGLFLIGDRRMLFSDSARILFGIRPGEQPRGWSDGAGCGHERRRGAGSPGADRHRKESFASSSPSSKNSTRLSAPILLQAFKRMAFWATNTCWSVQGATCRVRRRKGAHFPAENPSRSVIFWRKYARRSAPLT